MSGTKEIKIGAILSYAAIVFNIVAGLVYTPWMIEKIGPSQYGLYTLANSLIVLFMVDFGLSSATARYLSKFNAKGDREGAECFLGAVYKLYIVVDTVIFLVLASLFLFLDKIYVNLTPTELGQFKVVYVITALFSVVNFPFVTFNGILTAYEKFIPLKLIDVLYRIFNVGTTVIALFLGGKLYSLVIVHVVVGLSVLIAKFVVIKRTIPLKVNFKVKENSIYKRIFSFSIWSTVSSLAQRLVFNITPSILGIVSNTTAIAVFGVIVTIEGFTYTITTAINGMFMPRISRIVLKDENRVELSKLLLRVGKFQFALNGIIIIGFALVGKCFINLWLGKDYLLAYYGILLVIVPSLFFNSLQIANTTLVVENRVKLQAIINVCTGVINVILSFPLAKIFGVLGAAASISIAYMFRSIVINIVSSKVLKLDMKQFVKKCYIRMSLPIITTGILGIALNYFINIQSWSVLIIKAMIISLLYVVGVWLIGFEKEDKKLILNTIKRKM